MTISPPITEEMINRLSINDIISITGQIYCGRDTVLPRIVELAKRDELNQMGISLVGSVIFHSAVSCAGVGPTSSNKLEIESSIEPLSAAGVKLHLGKGAILSDTIKALHMHNAVYAIIPPITALLNSRTVDKEVIAFPEEGMEAFHRLVVVEYPAIIAAAHGKSIYV